MQELETKYQKRATDFSQTAITLRQKYNRFSFVRLLIFIAAVGLAIFLFTWQWWAGATFVLVFLIGFYRFIQWHQGVKRTETHHQYLARINEREQNTLHGEYAAFADGAEFVNPEHPYTVDLDIFGPYSFFQYCNRTSTTIGKRRLANYLKHPVEESEILRRQEAIKELQPKLNWRQHFQAHGEETEDDPRHINLLEYWLQQPAFVSNNRLLVANLYLAPLWFSLAVALWIFYLPWFLALLFLLPNIWALRQTVTKVNETHSQTTHAERLLASYAQLIQHIELADFESQKLQELQTAFTAKTTPASVAIRRLSYIISQLNVRYNVFAILLNLIGLWDLQWVYRLEKWKAEQEEALLEWFEALAEFEALSSFGNLYFNNPDWVFPKIHTENTLVAEALGHPLIRRSERVTNDLTSPTQGHIKLITGSNMAGKSTFLRTVGLNIVLAMTGAPVCAQRLELPLLQVYTSMRTQDALHESTSSFYAELKRLKFIIEAVERGDNVFFLLDEILKGTNSNDRHTGSKALIKQLIASKGGGLIATHDLELGQLETQYDGAIENLRIEVEIKNGELFFDYKLKKGVSESFNATLLMQQMGIRIGE